MIVDLRNLLRTASRAEAAAVVGGGPVYLGPLCVENSRI